MTVTNQCSYTIPTSRCDICGREFVNEPHRIDYLFGADGLRTTKITCSYCMADKTNTEKGEAQ